MKTKHSGLSGFIHATVEGIMSGEADPRAAAATLAYLAAQQRLVSASYESEDKLARLATIAKDHGAAFDT